MVIEIIISELDFHLIEKVRELRIKSKLSQVALAHKIGVSEGYIGNIENHKQNHKLNIRLLNRIALALELKSYIDLFPSKICSNDLVKIRLSLIDKEKKKNDNTSSEKIERFSKVLITPLSENEIIEYEKVKRSKK